MALPFLQNDQNGYLMSSVPANMPEAAVPITLPQAIAAYRRRAMEYSRQGSDLYNAEPDVSALQEFARQRGKEGEGAMLNALAAQFAGEAFQPVQAQFLRKAAAAAEPMKLGSGLLTSEGKYIKDPLAERDKRAEFLLNLGRNFEQMAATAQTAQERDERLSKQNEIANMMRMMGLNIQAMNAQNAAGNARDQQNARTWQVEDRMRDDYDKAVKDSNIVLGSFNNLRATPKSAAGDISFIYQYMKMLDPGSVVREGEFATAQNAAGVPDRIRNFANKIVSGERLNDQQREEFLNTARSLAEVATRRVQSAQQQTRETAQRRGVDVRNIYTPIDAPGTPGAGSASDPLGLRK